MIITIELLKKTTKTHNQKPKTQENEIQAGFYGFVLALC